jgi:hypothetical protein
MQKNGNLQIIELFKRKYLCNILPKLQRWSMARPLDTSACLLISSKEITESVSLVSILRKYQ